LKALQTAVGLAQKHRLFGHAASEPTKKMQTMNNKAQKRPNGIG
jgi:hypothetical protein